MSTRPLKFRLLHPNAKAPLRSTDEAAGYDLFALEAGVIKAQNRVLVSLGVSMELPQGSYGQIYARSGLAYREGLIVMAGVIDSDYRDEVKVLIYNTNMHHYKFNAGDRIAQMVIHKIIQDAPIVETFTNTFVCNPTPLPPLPRVTELLKNMPVEVIYIDEANSELKFIDTINETTVVSAEPQTVADVATLIEEVVEPSNIVETPRRNSCDSTDAIPIITINADSEKLANDEKLADSEKLANDEKLAEDSHTKKKSKGKPRRGGFGSTGK